MFIEKCRRYSRKTYIHKIYKKTSYYLLKNSALNRAYNQHRNFFKGLIKQISYNVY